MYMAIQLKEYQIKAIEKLKNGNILCGTVGSGKSRTALVYYYTRVCGGQLRVNGLGDWKRMTEPRDIYIITTAKKRDSKEWEREAAEFGFGGDLEEAGFFVDSWNNIKKYRNVIGAFFIFDEQRLVGSGAWVKAFLDISRKNQWILLSATPGDTWSDYIPVFVANGFYKNKTEFQRIHCVYSRFAKYPKIERYLSEKHLERLRDDILVKMKDERHTMRHDFTAFVNYDREQYIRVFRDRWDPYENCPVEETGKLCYLLRRVVNEDESRISAVHDILEEHSRAIIFYNFNYELVLLKEYLDSVGYKYAEWNGQKHEDLPVGDAWVYLVQYTAGCEGWNCITCNTMIFFSQNYSYRITEQAKGRIDRMNTPYRDLYYFILKSKASIDLAISRALASKKNFNERGFLG